MAVAFAQAGARAVIVADVDEAAREGGDTTVRLVENVGAGARFIRTDVTRPDELKAAIGLAEEFGGVDIMVNNAGVFSHLPLADAEEADFDRDFGVNVKGVFFGSKYASASMIDHRKPGVILNLASIAGIHGDKGFTLYTSTKGAVRLLSYSLADELGEHGIRVVAIHPGTIDTAMTTVDVAVPDAVAALIPLGRKGTPEDVANTAVWLASDAASFITGTSIVVDGGKTRVL